MTKPSSIALLGATCLLVACASKNDGESGPQTTFLVNDGQQVLGAIPWPSDLLRDANGYIAVDKLPLQDSTSTAGLLADLNTEQDGFGVTTGAYLSIGKFTANQYGTLMADPTAGSVDASTIDGHVHLYPLSCPDGSITTTTAELSVYTELRAQDTPQRIYARPERGVVLREKCTYAYVMTRDVKTDKGALVPSPDLAALLDDAAPESRLAAAYTIFAPLRTRLAAGPIHAADVASATVFTTHSLSADYVAGRAALITAGVPKLTVTYVFASTKTSDDDGSLDDLFGIPTIEQAGEDNPGGLSHAGIDYVIQGHFDSVDFLGGSTKNALGIDATAVGLVERDGKAPKVQGSILIPVTIVIPKGVDLTKVPFAVVQHGLTAQRLSMMSETNTLALRGIASILIDLPFHGARATDAVDMLHDYPMTAGPDGFAELQSDPSLAFFATNGNASAGIPPILPRAIRSAFFQSVNDIEQTFRMMSEGDLSPIGTREPRLATLKIDATREAYVGESFGSMIGTIVSAFEPKLAGTVLDVNGGGLIFPLLLGSAEFGPIFGPLLNVGLGTNAGATNDPVDTDWGYNLAQSLLEGGDSLAYGQFVVAKQSFDPNDMPCHVLGVSAFHDEVVPNPANLAVARALGLQPVTLSDGPAPDLTGWPEATASAAPLSANVGGQTAAFIQFPDASHRLLSVRVSEHDYDLSGGMEPFPKLAAPIPIMNPIDRANMIVGDFIAAALKGQAPTVQ